MPTPPSLGSVEGKAAMPVEVQLAAAAPRLPSAGEFRHWAECALQGQAGELCVRVVDAEESKALSARYLGVAAPTNVLSFPAGAGIAPVPRLLGDVVVCAAVVAEEAKRQAKAVADHFAHMVVHGVLHLRGYDHEEDQEARRMEGLETAILDGLGIADPYQPSSASQSAGAVDSCARKREAAAFRNDAPPQATGDQP